MPSPVHSVFNLLAHSAPAADFFGAGDMTWYVLGGVAACALVTLLIFGPLILLYVQAAVSDARITMLDLIGMKLRKTELRTIVYSYIRSRKAGLGVSVRELETHHLAGGRVSAVVSALIAAKGAGIDLAWDETISRDIAGRDVFGEVMAVTNQKNVSSFSPAGKKY